MISSTSSGIAKASPSLLSTLLEFQTLQQTRHALLTELDVALSSYLLPGSSSTPIPADTSPDLPVVHSPHSCAHESHTADQVSMNALDEVEVRAPNEMELGEIMRIGFLGLVEVGNELMRVQEELECVWEKRLLGKTVGKVRELEEERFKETIKRDQLRRLSILEPSRDFTLAVKEANDRRNELALEIQEESQEITAEIAELQHEEII